MSSFIFATRASYALAALGLLAFLGVAPAAAKGVTTIQKSDGSKDVYPNVGIALEKRVALTVTSPNGKDKLIIDKAACSYVGALQRCLISHVSLESNGKTKPLDLATGTVYANLTDAQQQMPLSSQQLPPKGVLVALKTQIGTYITVEGTIDGDVK